MRPITSVRITLALAVAAVSAPLTVAVPLYSVNIVTDELVHIESTTGAITTVGALGYNAFDIDLALTADGRLWGLNSGGSQVQIWEINKSTGAVISSANVLEGATPALYAEGLGARGNQLKIGYDLVSTGNSIRLGDLASTGAVSVSHPNVIDMDALADGGGNPFELYAFDRNTGTNTTFYGIDLSTGSATKIADYSDSLGFHDLVTLSGEAIALDTFTGQLHRLNLTSGTVLDIQQIGPTASGSYNGLALAEPLSSAVPEGGVTAALLGLAFTGLASSRIRPGRSPRSS